MRDIVEKLLKDMQRRLALDASSNNSPKPKERNGWGRWRIPGAVPFLLWIAYMILALTIWGDSLLPWLPGWLEYLLFNWPGWLTSLILFCLSRSSLQRTLDLRAYRSVLERSERLTLVEYCKYLKRQLKLAQKDKSLGGAAEVERLSKLHERLNELLKQGAGKAEWQVIPSKLGEEADQAESLVEFYEGLKADPLKELDARLPDELRQRVEELDRDSGGSTTSQQVETGH